MLLVMLWEVPHDVRNVYPVLGNAEQPRYDCKANL